ncbi:MAG: hypothetical protein ACRDRL_19565 [Sciscionella sp.]
MSLGHGRCRESGAPVPAVVWRVIAGCSRERSGIAIAKWCQLAPHPCRDGLRKRQHGYGAERHEYQRQP